MIRLFSKGNFSSTRSSLKNLSELNVRAEMERGGKRGVAALASATPVETGLTASQWDFEIKGGAGRYEIHWFNHHENKGENIAILLQYGHGTGTGGYVQGRDFINPAIQPIFDQIADDIWRAVTRA